MKRLALLAVLLSGLLASEAQAQYHYQKKHYGYRSRADYPQVRSRYSSTPYGSSLTTTTSGAFGSNTISTFTPSYTAPSFYGYPTHPMYSVPSFGYGGYYGGSYGAYGGFGGGGFGGSSYGGYGVW